VFSEQHERSVREIVAEDFPEAATLVGHGLCAALTEADTVSLAGAFQDHLPVIFARSEVVARHCVPAETPVHSESSGFAFSKERGVL
jgi:hypothetical protein